MYLHSVFLDIIAMFFYHNDRFDDYFVIINLFFQPIEESFRGIVSRSIDWKQNRSN